MAQASTVLRWGGRLLVVAAAVNGVVPQDDCGSAFWPNSMADDLRCTAARADRMDTVILLGSLGLVALIVGQVLNWRKKKQVS